ncbi:hypothetical protein [Fictibacillus sp. JL2B1089]|uniref:hypothetical protein n=1 Tax=Fictibacillus sp. JL2B1089 TaxID=3399565 RepID=UPI003A8593DC
MVPTNKADFMKTLSFGLIFYAIFMGIGGTFLFASIIFGEGPQNTLSKAKGPLTIMMLMVYGSCTIALFIRAFLKKRGWI